MGVGVEPILARAFPEFLRARRASLDPESFGYSADGRRVPGLRRHEFAELVGLSVEYYTKLEQGRASNPSPAVVGAIADALDLGRSERDYLIGLDQLDDPTDEPPWKVPNEVGQLVASLSEMVPAFVLTPATDVIAWNAVGGEAFCIAGRSPTQRNVARQLFMDAPTRAMYGDWERVVREQVAWLRYDTVRHPRYRALFALIEELLDQSPEFRKLWDRYEIRSRSHGRRLLDHPDVGVLDMYYTALPLPADPRLTIVTWSAAKSTETADKLHKLAERSNSEPVTIAAPATDPDAS
ncbi:helix-turn-helix transcriptional regulator [Antrihabitans cavernicola]|uniref:Helix-turn-helix domain-containing protein n=1 Tax=Antrihabitans cavernicola TaxID=2495913 RepID=A0A5A7S781_9NOCA|nr:helix-turn-helix transcriptional regulator [Spelaeibacter cavernicola]KAA0021354.1 helix-turn-helix domain-containing protein [Spelaeibacter cavernicola]